MKFLIFGAGVLGSYYAARLHEAGEDVTLLARGKRYDDLVRHGVMLEHFKTGKEETVHVKTVDQMPAEEAFDVCVVLVQNHQLPGALDIIKTSRNISTYLIMTNFVKGPDEILDQLENEKVMIGHVNAGGERDGPVVKYMVSQAMTLGELSGRKTKRLADISEAFKNAGFPVEISHNIDAWKRHHMALLLPVCHAMYLCGSCNYELSRNKAAMQQAMKGSEQAMNMLDRNGYPVEPAKLKSLFKMPSSLLVFIFRKIMGTKLMDIGGARHARNARDEVMKLSKDLIVLADEWNESIPAVRELYQRVIESETGSDAVISQSEKTAS